MVERPRVRRVRARRLACALALGALATACVTDVNSEQGEDAHPLYRNDRGVMVGWDGSGKITRFNPDKTRVKLSHPWGNDGPFVQDLNDQNEILARESYWDGEHMTPAFPVMWDDAGTLTDLRPFIADSATNEVTMASLHINDQGLVVGTTQDPYRPGQSRQPTHLFAIDTRARRAIPIPPEVAGTNPWLVAMNDKGVVIGHNDAGIARWTWRGDRFDYERIVLPFVPRDINNNGDVVGSLLNGTPERPAIWRAGTWGPVPLPDAGWPVGSNANGFINDAGMIVFTLLDRPYGEATKPVRWTRADAAPEQFPTEDWTKGRIYDLDNDGAALGYATRKDGVERAIRWT